MRKKGIALLAALLLALLAGCGANGAAQPEQIDEQIGRASCRERV